MGQSLSLNVNFLNRMGYYVWKPLAPVVRKVDNAIRRINHYPVDKCWQNKPRYPLDSDLSGR